MVPVGVCLVWLAFRWFVGWDALSLVFWAVFLFVVVMSFRLRAGGVFAFDSYSLTLPFLCLMFYWSFSPIVRG